jgi:hypothetical protein
VKIKNGVIAAAVAALALGTAVPAHASDAGPCQLMGPNYLDGVRSCACIVTALISDTPLPDQHGVCPS